MSTNSKVYSTKLAPSSRRRKFFQAFDIANSFTNKNNEKKNDLCHPAHHSSITENCIGYRSCKGFIASCGPTDRTAIDFQDIFLKLVLE
jgi:hypothetical protein